MDNIKLTIIFDEPKFVTGDQIRFMEMLSRLSDEELAHHFPKLAAKYDRDGIIKAVVFGVEK